MVELAEHEVNTFAKVWAKVFVSLSYCYTIGKLTPKGFVRLLATLPIMILFLFLPLNLTSFHLGGTTAFFIAWLANFKLLLFAFGKGPLCVDPNISFTNFIAFACLPIKPQNDPKPEIVQKSENKTNPDLKSQNKTYPDHKKPSNSIWNYIVKVILLLLIIRIYDYHDHIHPKIMSLIICFHIYFGLEIILALLAKSAQFFLGFELEPTFDEPLLSTSLQDFWGRRWNIMANRILKPTVYQPTLTLSSHIVGRKWAPLPAIMGSFLVSGIMHELIFYYLGHLPPTFEATWFFTLHGVCLCIEVVIKKAVNGKWKLPRWLSGPLTVVFVTSTGLWLFLPPLLRAGLYTNGVQEYAAFGKFARAWLS